MHRVSLDKAQMLTDTVQSYGSLMLDAECCSQGRSLVVRLSLLLMEHAAKVLNSVFVGLFIKTKWHKADL